MERKIGEIFEYNGEWYQCVEGLYCYDCAFVDDNCEDRERITLREKLTKQPVTGFCNSNRRKDGKDVIFKELEKVGEPITVKDRTFQCLNAFKTECTGCVFLNSKRGCDKYHYIDDPCPDREIWVELKQNKEDMEEKKLNLKPFSLELAKQGKPVCTRDGRKARIVCFNRRDDNNYNIVALIEDKKREEVRSYYNDGKYLSGDEEAPLDLMMLPEKKEGWINLSKDTVYFDKKEIAEKNCLQNYFTVKIEWEE